MLASEPIEQYKAGKRNFRGADLSGAMLSDADLSDADLSGADLSGANFWGADLSGADLRGANLQGADLSDADLRGAAIDDGKIITGYFTRTRIGSETGELQISYNATEIWLKRGCSGWLTPDKFLARVELTHGDNLHAQIYRLTVAHIVEVVALERQLQAVAVDE